MREGKIVHLETIKSTGKKGDDIRQRASRLDYISQWIGWIFADHEMFSDDLAVIEAPSYGSSFGSAHDRSGLWWLVMLDIIQRDVPVALVSPQGRAKYGTGNGRSKKPEVYAAVKEAYGPLCPRPIKNNDEADAILLAAIGARGYTDLPVEPVSPADRNLEALTGVHWPGSLPE